MPLRARATNVALVLALALALSLTTLTPRPVRAGWAVLPSSPLEGFRHQDIAVANPTTAWIVAGSGLVHKTTDGGASWRHVATLSAYLRSVAFADSLRGWIGTLSSDSLLFATTDAGESWSLVQNIPEPRPLGICGMDVVTPSVVYGCGRYYGPPRLIKTTNGGASWSTIDLSAYATTLVDCYFASADTGFVVGGIGQFSDSTRAVVLATTDGGASWQTRFTGTLRTEWCWKIAFPTRDVGYVSLQRNVAPVGFLKTTDGGATWERKPLQGPSYFYPEQGIGFATESVGWIGGGGFVWATTDGGDSWQQEPWGTNVNRFRFVNEGLGYAVGNRVYKYDGAAPTFVAAGDAGDVDAPAGGNPLSTTSARFFLANAPNPFHAFTEIDFVLDYPGFVSLAIYDLAGRRVARLVEARIDAGRHSARWDGVDASGRASPAGVYVYRLETAGHHESRSMVLLR